MYEQDSELNQNIELDCTEDVLFEKAKAKLVEVWAKLHIKKEILKAVEDNAWQQYHFGLLSSRHAKPILGCQGKTPCDARTAEMFLHRDLLPQLRVSLRTFVS